MNEIDVEEKINMLDRIYNTRMYDFEQNANIDRKELAEKLNNVTMEEIEKILQDSLKEQYKKQEIIGKLDKLVENYEIKMAYYMEKRYKQGFIDAIHLIKECDNK